jgi:localization factor PodJL
MNSRVSWSVEGIDSSVRERAEAAARRAGMSLNDWLNCTIGDSTPPTSRNPADSWLATPSPQTREVADIHQRLDSITRQIEQISQAPTRPDAPRSEPGVARQLNEAISRLDARLAQLANPAPSKPSQPYDKQRPTDAVELAAAQVYRPSPPLSPASLDLAVAEIAARQSELDHAAPRPMPPRHAPPKAADKTPSKTLAQTPVQVPAQAPAIAPTGPDFSSLERHLLKITSQIEALQRPDGIEQSIAAFRGELAEIRHAITEAMPRQAIESIENEIRSLSRRIDETRQSGIDGKALVGIEQALSEIREVLRSLTPAEQLAGYDEAIRNLGTKLDLILRTNDDPSTVHQLENAIAALRSIVSNVASTDALARLTDDVRTLSSKVDQLARAGDNSDSFAALEQRIAALTSTLESRERPVVSPSSEHLESAVRALSERLDRIPVGNDSASAFAHLEQRVSYLLERLEASSDPRAGGLGRVENGLQDILRHLETQQTNFAALAESRRNMAPPQDNGLIDIVKRELSDIRFNQSETNRHTQDSLEAVHNTLGHVVDRLAMIEGDLRNVRNPPVAARPPMPPAPQVAPPPADTPRVAIPPQQKPELPNPAAAQIFAAAPREFQPAQPPMPTAVTAPPRAAIEPSLPPDHPLEPGTRPTQRISSPSERIAASESAISEIPTNPAEKASTSSFIAAARRAAQAAAATAAAGQKAGRNPQKNAKNDKATEPSTITSKIRSLLVGASVVVIVLSTFKMAMTLLDGDGAPQTPAVETSSEPPPSAPSPSDDRARMGAPVPAITAPTPTGRQSLNISIPNGSDGTPSVPIPQTTATTSLVSAGDITNAIPASTAPAAAASSHKLAWVQIPPNEKLPDAIGGPMLHAAALKGDPTAAYEIGVRYAEGKGIASNFDAAAKWYDRAAQAGVVPAIFRLGTLYEKGLSVQKDVEIARRYYVQAAERGNAKAMHNLAVLEADGGGKGANYKSAAQWFRQAADHGVADSQFNLGILYARGIGLEQNLAESFKWFSLAAAQGDADAARKRDDVAKRLDAQSLAAAQLAIQTFTPEPQPDDAVNVATPPGGWDGTPTQANTAKPGAKPVLTKRAAR